MTFSLFVAAWAVVDGKIKSAMPPRMSPTVLKNPPSSSFSSSSVIVSSSADTTGASSSRLIVKVASADSMDSISPIASGNAYSERTSPISPSVVDVSSWLVSAMALGTPLVMNPITRQRTRKAENNRFAFFLIDNTSCVYGFLV